MVDEKPKLPFKSDDWDTSDNSTSLHTMSLDSLPSLELDSVESAGLVQLNGKELGRMFILDPGQSMLVGRSSSAELQIEGDSVSRHHALLVHTGQQVHVSDLDSTNGTFLNNTAVKERVLRDGDMLNVGRNIFKFLIGSSVENSYHQTLYRLTTTDPLTEAFNKRHFLENLERELSRSIRHNTDLSVMILDIDHFKTLNDTHGHLKGDFVLKELSARIQSQVRQEDLFARFGGEEFVLFMPNTNLAQATHLANMIRLKICEKDFDEESTPLSVTISVGVSSLSEFGDENPASDGLLKLADDRLYEAKAQGRNCVIGV